MNSRLYNVAGQMFSRGRTTYSDEVWVLKGVSFEVSRGEIIGIQGSNGSGKTTLFKILSGIVRPSEGQIEIAGRVATLLDSQAGFHPELTVQENIYLLGRLCGMKKQKLDRSLSQILAKSGVEERVDDPLKLLSLGTAARLSFAIAMAATDDILLVDEAFSSLDQGWKTRFLNELRARSLTGGTALIISHEPEILKACDRLLKLEGGRIQLDLGDKLVDHQSAYGALG